MHAVALGRHPALAVRDDKATITLEFGDGSVETIHYLASGDAVHVLHAFQKKSKSGVATPQPDVDLIEKRMKAVLARRGASGRS